MNIKLSHAMDANVAIDKILPQLTKKDGSFAYELGRKKDAIVEELQAYEKKRGVLEIKYGIPGVYFSSPEKLDPTNGLVFVREDQKEKVFIHCATEESFKLIKDIEGIKEINRGLFDIKAEYRVDYKEEVEMMLLAEVEIPGSISLKKLLDIELTEHGSIIAGLHGLIVNDGEE